MEDFGYSKEDQSKTEAIIKRAFMIGATLFSVACFIYITVNAYYFVYNDKNKNIDTIKAPVDPMKVVMQEVIQDGSYEGSIYEDIFNKEKPDVKIKSIQKPITPPSSEVGIIKPVKNIQTKPIIVFNKDSETEKKPVIVSVQKVQKRQIRVQISALASKDSAKNYWKNLNKDNSQLVSGLQYFIEEADLGKRGIFYRLQIGNFSDQIRAEEFCDKYVSQTGRARADCIIVE
jgi:cell division septation protein DedD